MSIRNIRMKKWNDIFYKLKIFHNRMYYMPHYSEIDNTKISITKLIRDIWIDELSANKKEDWDDYIYCIYGELSSIDTIIHALENKINVKVIFGNQIDPNNKNAINDLKKEHKDHLRIYSYKYHSNNCERPKYHSTLIGSNLLFESYHDIGDKYNQARIIEYADKATINEYWDIYYKYEKESTELTTDTIQSMRTLNTNCQPCQC